ncbi:TBC1 domain family member 10B [Tachysurus ichikawai]
MAEVSALTPSPPAVGDQSVAPPSSSSAPSLPAESPKPIVVPKSALYGDRAVMAAAALIPPRKETSVRLSNSGEAISALSENPPPVPSASESTCPPDRGKESFPTTPEPLMQPNISPEPQGRAADPEAPPFPEQNPTTQLNLTSNSTSSSHTPPHSPPSIVPIIQDPLSDLKSDLPSLMVQDSFVPYTGPPPGQSGPALDTLSYLESASMMSGTLESLSGIGEDGSSLGSDSELNGPVQRRTDKYGFLGGSQYSEGKWQAFWCLVQICEKYLPGYYSAGLEAIQLDGEIFFSLLRRVCPMAYRHLKKYKIDPILYMTEWFMCIFSRTLPWSCVLRVWDMFFCEGETGSSLQVFLQSHVSERAKLDLRINKTALLRVCI